MCIYAIYMCLPAWMYVGHTHAMFMEARKEYQISQNWSYGQEPPPGCWEPKQGPVQEPLSVFNCWALSSPDWFLKLSIHTHKHIHVYTCVYITF